MKIPSEEFGYFQKYLDLKNRKMLITETKLREIENIKPKRLLKHNAYNGRAYIYETPQEALEELKIYANLKDFEKEEKIKLEIVVNLDLDRPDHNLNGFCNLAGGLGENPKICVITTDDNKDICYDAGAFIVMHSEQLENLSKLDDPLIEFNRIICSKDELETIEKFKEFFDKYDLHLPNVKSGTCVSSSEDLIKVINLLKSNYVIFETENRVTQGHDMSTFKETIINLEIGNKSLGDSNILLNIDSAMQTLLRVRPRSVMGRYLLSANLHIGEKFFRINIKSMDPSERAYFAKNKKIKNILFK
jgi:ribosomal protein L1